MAEESFEKLREQWSERKIPINLRDEIHRKAEETGYADCVRELWEPGGTVPNRDSIHQCMKDKGLRKAYKKLWGRGGSGSAGA